MNKKERIWVDSTFKKFLVAHKDELKQIIPNKKKVSDLEGSRYIVKKYSFGVQK